MFTKQQIIEKALEEIGLAAYILDIEPDELQSALERLDLFAANWGVDGYYLRYPFFADPADSSLTDEVDLPFPYTEALFVNFGVALAPVFGVQLTEALMKHAYDTKKALRDGLESPMPIFRNPTAVPVGAGVDRYLFGGFGWGLGGGEWISGPGLLEASKNAVLDIM